VLAACPAPLLATLAARCVAAGDSPQQTLMLDGPELTAVAANSHALSALEALTSVQRLSVSDLIGPRDWDALRQGALTTTAAALPSLCSLTVSNVYLPAERLAELAMALAERLISFTADTLRVPHPACETLGQHLTCLRRLERLDVLRYAPVRDACLRHIATMTRLRVLKLKLCSGFTARGLAHLTVLANLTCLDISFSMGVCDVGMRHVGKLKSLQLLDVSDAPISSCGIASLAGLAALRCFCMARCKRVDADASQHLATWTSLEDLYLEDLYLASLVIPLPVQLPQNGARHAGIPCAAVPFDARHVTGRCAAPAGPPRPLHSPVSAAGPEDILSDV
jgi:hypothetical protein